MRQISILFLLFSFVTTVAQEQVPQYEKSGDLVKATYFYEDGSIKEQGFFKDKKLTGQWIRYDQNGNKTMIAHYQAGKKVGKWFSWTGDILKEINFEDNAIVSVRKWTKDSELAFN